MKQATYFTRASEIIFTTSNDSTQLFQPDTGAFYAIKGIGQLVWNSLGVMRAVDELVSEVIHQYEIDESAARQDITEFLAVLVERGLVTERATPKE